MCFMATSEGAAFTGGYPTGTDPSTKIGAVGEARWVTSTPASTAGHEGPAPDTGPAVLDFEDGRG
jgi:hypothetical protein